MQDLLFYGGVPRWGKHICHFYRTKEELTGILVPYFAAGLENNEFCVWLTSEPLSVNEAKKALGNAVTDVNSYIEKYQIQIIDAIDWYIKLGKFEPKIAAKTLIAKERDAIKRGFVGLRVAGNSPSFEKKDWRELVAYEADVDDLISKYRVIAVCSYPIDKCGPAEIADLVSNHRFTIIWSEDKWRLIKNVTRERLETKYQNIIQATKEGFCVIDTQGNFMDVNPAFCSLVGYDPYEILSMNLRNIEASRDAVKIAQHIELVKQKGYDLYETSLICKDGRNVRVEVSANYIDIDGGQVFTFMRDITECKEGTSSE